MESVVTKRLLTALASAVLSCPAMAQDTPTSVNTDGGILPIQRDAPYFAGRGYSPYAGRRYPTQVFWGDQHLHTSWSADAGGGGTRLDPADALRFARGEMVTSNTGQQARLAGPLDFLVVTDHAENLGLPTAIAGNDPVLTSIPWGQKIIEKGSVGGIDGMIATYEFWMEAVFSGEDPLAGTDFARTMWEKVTEAAERHNMPGAFTAMIGFEWTSQPDGANMHRNVIYRDGKQIADQAVPISTFDTDDPKHLWDWMEAFEAQSGGRVLAIPHGGNLSNGLMFDDVTLTDKRPLDAAYAKRRMRWEPIYEITQIKGDGEAYPALSPGDEFADYETWDNGSFGPEPKTPARRSNAAWPMTRISASIRSSSASSVRPMPIPG